MKNIRDFLTVMFRDITAQDILDDKEPTEFNNVNTPLVLKLMEQRLPQYSRNELENLLSYFRDIVSKSKMYSGKNYSKEEEGPLNVFHLLTYYTNQLLTMNNGEIEVKYDKLLHWKDLSFALSEDVMTCCFMAHQANRNARLYDEADASPNFDWPQILEHDNYELKMITKKGMADNHYHTKGSIHFFAEAWKYLLFEFKDEETHSDLKQQTRLEDLGDISKLERIEEVSRNATYHVSTNHHDLGLYPQLIQATLIRNYLSEIIKQTTESTDEKDKEISQKLGECGRYPKRYARKVHSKKNKKISAEYGEREFLYECFRRISGDSSKKIQECDIRPFTRKQKNFFYMYLLIQNRFRVELVQINRSTVGYANFSTIEERKDVFINDKKININALSICETLANPDVKYLEARMSPRPTSEAYKTYLNKIYNAFPKSGEGTFEKLSSRFRYIIHFVKRKDDNDDSFENHGNWHRQRHLRNDLKNQAIALDEFHNSDDPMAKMIIGIDACNSEIGCRPEVFAPIFRMLRNSRPKDPSVKPLRVTYHVGEDFLDIADGLRAIHEAIHFLNLRNGDRLGHALALGIDATDWYRKKYRLFIPKQDYLDNIAWMYQVLTEYQIPDTDHLKTFLNSEFHTYFEQIYLPYIKDGDVNGIIKKAQTYYKEAEIHSTQNFFRKDFLNFDIFDYYRSWELRGDDPLCYKKGYFSHTEEQIKTCLDKWMVNDSYPADFQIRFTPQPAILNYYYQFNKDVRNAGQEIARIKVKDEYVQAVHLIQKAMENEISRLGIAIEANPTSNYLISNFKHYDKHPIIHWYNHSLTADPEQLANSPQLNVSINTDDQGVFTTRLDNEFALMALALEDMKDENGNPVYKRRDVYRWIDEIREMGIRQNFIYQAEESGH